MKKLLLITLSFFAFAGNIIAQCNSWVDTTTKNINCGDSIQLSSSFFKTSTLTSGTIYDLWSVYFPDSNTGYAVGDGGTIIKTINGGTNWTAQTSGTLYTLRSIYFTDTNTGYTVADGGTILKTINGGTNWAALSSGTTNSLNSTYFTGTDTGYAVGESGTILKTINGGTNWTAQTSGTTDYLLSVYFTNANTGYAVGFGGTILKTINSGSNWIAQTSGTTNDLYSVYFSDSNTGYAVGGNGTILKTINAGTTWSAQTSGTMSFYSVYFTDANTGYAVGQYGIIRTINGGTNWTETYGTSNYLLSVYFADTNTGYAVGEHGTIVKLSDFNNVIFSWQPIVGLDNSTSQNPIAKPTISQTYTVTITPNISTGCSPYTDSVRVNIIPFTAPEICMVSIRNNKNFIIWDKPISSAIDSFLIWRETSISGVYNKIGSTAYTDSSIFVDYTSNPLVQSSKYKISIKDACGMESAKSDTAHKTMHLSINSGMGTTWNLIWEAYEGFTVSTYNIYRGTDPDSLVFIGSTSGSSTQYTDYTAPAGFVYYQLEVVNPNACNPSKSYTTSMSNIATNDPSFGISTISFDKNFKVYPNPVSNELIIEIKGNKEKTDFEILNSIGQIVFKGNMSEKSVVQTSNFCSGVYLIKLKNGKTFEFKKIVKE